MKTLALIAALFILAPCAAAAAAESGACAGIDNSLLKDLMVRQARTGIIILGIAGEWRMLGDAEIKKLAEVGPDVGQAAVALLGRIPDPVLISAPDYTKERADLLVQAAKTLAEADALILECYKLKALSGTHAARLEHLNAQVSDLLGAIAQEATVAE